ncbi:MAG: class I SAM-dependent methyltransferase [Clostridia bacterium]|nr:class I SAM-dependent methyltransferase [Clostridia bacterium]
MDRISQLCTYLEKCAVFADVACDHGYCTKFMLDNRLCDKAIVSDISEKSLSKAQILLEDYIRSGVCSAVCCDGLEKVRGADLVMIAGIGGEEIIKILSNAEIPQNFIFQPMKNAKELRSFLLVSGCHITCDDIFTDGKKYYFIIKGKNRGSKQSYSKAQLEYGADSLKNPVFSDFLKTEIKKKKSYLSRGLNESSRENIQKSIDFMQGVLKGEIK